MKRVLLVITWLVSLAPVAAHAAQLLGYGSLPDGAWACLGSPRFTGSNPVRSVAYSRDGKRLAVGTTLYHAGRGAPIYIWDLETGQQLHTLKGHTEQVVALRFAADDRTLLSAAWDNTVRIWDLATGKEVRQLVGHTRVITGLELSRDGKSVVTSSQDETNRVWDLATGKERRQMKCWASAIALGPDDHTLAAATAGVILWDIRSGKEVRRIKPAFKNTTVFSVRFSPDGKTLAVNEGHQLYLYDPATGKERRLPGPRQRLLGAAGFSPDGKRLVTATTSLEQSWLPPDAPIDLAVWDVTTGKRVAVFPRHGPVVDIAFAPDGKSFATVGSGWYVRIWDAATCREWPRFTGHAGPVASLAFAAHGGTLFSSSQDGTIRAWDAENVRERAVLRGHERAVTSISLTPDGKTLASGSIDGTVRLWDTTTGKSRTLGTGQGEVWCVAFSPDGQVLASGDRGQGGAGGALRLWSWRESKELHRSDDQGGAHCLSFAPDGKTLAVGHHTSIFLWVTATGKIRRQLHTTHVPFVTALGFLGDGTLASSGDGDKPTEQAVRLWEVMDKKQLHQLGSARDSDHTTLAVAPDRRLVAGAFEQRIQVWEASTRQKVADLSGHRGHVSALAFHPDGRTLASGGADGAILLWDLSGLRTGKPRAEEPEVLWERLGAADAVAARRALWALAATPDRSVPLLRRHLRPVPVVTPKQMAELIAALDADEFAAREKAMRELAGLGEIALPHLRRTLEGKPAPEQRSRCQRLLASFKAPTLTPAILRELRGVEALERAGTPEARALLRTLADGAPEARLTRAARAALTRRNGR